MAHPYVDLLRDRAVRILWSGLTLSAVGGELYRVGAIWLAAELAGPKAALLITAQAAAMLAMSLLAGPVVEPLPRRGLLIACELLQATASLAVVLAAAAAGLTFPMLVTASVILAALGAITRPVFLSSLPGIAPEGRLRETNGLFDSALRIAQSTGPFLAAAAMNVMPAIHLLTVNAVSFLASAGVIAAVGGRLDSGPRRKAGGNWRRAIGRGVRAANGCPGIWSVLIATGVRGGGYALGFSVAVPVLFAGQPGPGGLGAVALVFGACAAMEVISTPVLVLSHPARPLRRLFEGYALIGLGVTALGLAAGLPPGWQLAAMCAAAIVVGLGNSVATLQITTFFASRLDSDDYAAVLRLRMVTIIGSMMATTAVGPWVLSALGPATTIVVCGLAAAAAGVAGMLGGPARRLGGDFQEPGDVGERTGEPASKLAS
jgi:DHA3 family macrolide efflux protein-like MFS transporter